MTAPAMLQQLLINFALLTALTYLFSLTFRAWPLPHTRIFQAQSILLGAAISLVLILFPAQIAPGIIIDMRSIPLIFVALVFGLPSALLAAIPMLAYRLWMGGPGVIPAGSSILLILLVVWLLRERFMREGVTWRERTALATLMLLPNGLPLGLLPGGLQILAQSYLPLLLLNVSGFMVTLVILTDRLKLLRLNALFQQQAYQDKLSGLHNRRQFDTDLPSITPGDLVMMVDIDHFKHINDTYGHLVGDKVLAEMGRLLSGSLRPADRAYRYGGEEFVLLLRSPKAGCALPIAERLRQQIDRQPLSIPAEGQTLDLNVNVSIGAAWHVAAQPPAQTVAQADQALYQAKQTGRNRSVVFKDNCGAME
ncbi:GGDEF domain-containing protein [Deinococcus radiophilus]|nr:diguanylate cyclase [Deinococcus radiophilus]UFA51546.1 diguanylate cyclase [Deinococcus radiophilus]